MPTEVGITCCLPNIRPLLEYGVPIWGEIPDYLVNELESIQRRSLDTSGLPRDFLPSLEEKRKTITTREFRGIKDDVNHPEHQSNLRTRNLCPSVRSGTERYKHSFKPKAISLSNSYFNIL